VRDVSLGAATSRRSPSLVAFLSFLWPGLGHWYAGRQTAAAIFAVPAIWALIPMLLQAVKGIEQLALLLILPTSALAVLILVALLGAWRTLALADSLRGLGPGAWRTGRTPAVAAALVLAIVASHAWIGYVAWAGFSAGRGIFVGAQAPTPTPAPGTSPAPTPSDDFIATPLTTPQTKESRINILLTGVDSAESRTTALTDTLMVVSIDPAAKKVSLINFPRDIANFPLWTGEIYRGKINSLMTYARFHEDVFPDGPLPTLVRELGYLLGSPIHYYAAIDLDGFRKLIDEVGGVTIVNQKALNDGRYDWMDGTRGFFLPAGEHTLDGRHALAYVRSRFSVGDNDFNRSRRQQQVLLALREKLTRPEMLARIPTLFELAGKTVRTNFPADRVSEMVELAKQVDNDEVFTVVLGPPYALHPPSETTGGIYTLKLDMVRMSKLSIKLFGNESAYAQQPAP
jgi:polyisoprenyl-teichoic acid--peptidoglycan teichoic acid transferase